MIPSALLILASAVVVPPDQHRYDVHVDAALQRMEVRACFADGLPERLIANHALATKATLQFRYQRDGSRVAARPGSNAIILRIPSDDGCIEWTTDLEVIANANRVNVGYRANESLVLAPGTWFWHPPVLTARREIVFYFHLPDGMQISAPWTPLGSTGKSATSAFRYGHAPLQWSSLMMIGKMKKAVFTAGGARFRLAVADGPAQAGIETVTRWLQPAAGATAMLWGEFPVEDVQVLVVPLFRGNDAAPWAQTNRGGGAAAHFYMNASATDEMRQGDWIATHEFAHLALPFVARDDAWLPEGFASYYQHVLRARAGLLTPLQAWQALHDGFMRGHRDTEYETLADDTRFMHSRGRVMRVYWSGAAIALLADVELRRRSKGAWSLDRVLGAFHRCCRLPQRTWTGRELFDKFDAITGTDTFMTLYRDNVHSRHFPRLTEIQAELGIEVRNGVVQLRDDAPGADMRADIMAPPEPEKKSEWRIPMDGNVE